MTNGKNKENRNEGLEQSTHKDRAPEQKFSSGTPTGAGAAAAATARSFYDQAKETAGQAYEVVTEKAATKLDEQKSTLSGGLSTVADSVRQVSSNLNSAKTDSGLAEAAARYTDSAARSIENLAGYFETHDVREMARDLEGFARRNPAVFLGVAFGLGFLAARFLRSTPPRYASAGASVGEIGEGGRIADFDRPMTARSDRTI